YPIPSASEIDSAWIDGLVPLPIARAPDGVEGLQRKPQPIDLDMAHLTALRARLQLHSLPRRHLGMERGAERRKGIHRRAYGASQHIPHQKYASMDRRCAVMV